MGFAKWLGLEPKQLDVYEQASLERSKRIASSLALARSQERAQGDVSHDDLVKRGVLKGEVEFEFALGKNDIVVVTAGDANYEGSLRHEVESALKRRGRVCLVLPTGTTLQVIHRPTTADEAKPAAKVADALIAEMKAMKRELDGDSAINQNAPETLIPVTPRDGMLSTDGRFVDAVIRKGTKS